MSLEINVDDVIAVLIGDTWYSVEDQSFNIDSYEFTWGETLIHGGGHSGVCASGYSFTTRTCWSTNTVWAPDGNGILELDAQHLLTASDAHVDPNGPWTYDEYDAARKAARRYRRLSGPLTEIRSVMREA